MYRCAVDPCFFFLLFFAKHFDIFEGTKLLSAESKRAYVTRCSDDVVVERRIRGSLYMYIGALDRIHIKRYRRRGVINRVIASRGEDLRPCETWVWATVPA